MRFNSRAELVDWLTEVAKEKLEHDVLTMLEHGMDYNLVMTKLAPVMAASAMAERDQIIANVDSLVMDMNANAPEHSTIN
jgi:hypothetical protein